MAPAGCPTAEFWLCLPGEEVWSHMLRPQSQQTVSHLRGLQQIQILTYASTNRLPKPAQLAWLIGLSGLQNSGKQFTTWTALLQKDMIKDIMNIQMEEKPRVR